MSGPPAKPINMYMSPEMSFLFPFNSPLGSQYNQVDKH